MSGIVNLTRATPERETVRQTERSRERKCKRETDEDRKGQRMYSSAERKS